VCLVLAAASEVLAILPPPPDVDDSMLTPVPSAPHIVTSWQDALKMINSHDAQLKIAQAEVERAIGERRQALGPALPQFIGGRDAELAAGICPVTVEDRFERLEEVIHGVL
jgi:hypothetical protein